MESEIIQLLSKDGTPLHGIIWSCPNPKAIVCIVHGLGGHSGRYAHIAEYLTSNNLTVFAFDQRGHGLSGGKRGHTPSYDILLDDVEELLKEARVTHNDLPIFLYGHSFGGNVVANYALIRSTNELRGLIVSSPWLKLAKEPPAGQVKLARIVSKIFPSFTQPNGLDVEDISTDEIEVNAYSNDPLVHDKMSTKLFTEVYNAGLWAIKHADGLKNPMLVFHGSDDNITSPRGSEEFVEQAGSLAEFKLWENMKHETHYDLKKEEVISYMHQWIADRIKTIHPID